jgi:hypothetical protein
LALFATGIVSEVGIRRKWREAFGKRGSKNMAAASENGGDFKGFPCFALLS